jgi:hypothetical protein
VRAIGADGGLIDVRIFEFDEQGKIASQTRAATGQVQGSDDAAWVLRDVQRSVFHQRAADEAQVEHQKLPEWRWPTNISADMIAASLLKPDRMATFDLFQYIRHLDDNGQSAQRYEIEFWRKVFYPLSCLVMVVLALPFAYLHFPLRQHCRLCFRGRHGGHQLLFAQQRVWLRGQPAKLVSLAHRCRARAHLLCVVTGRLWLAGAAALARRSPFWRANSLIPHP